MTSSSNADSSEAVGNVPPRRKVPLHVKILIGLLIGAALGIAANVGMSGSPEAPLHEARDANQNNLDDRVEWFATNLADPIGKVFLRLVLMIVVPLVYSALVLGVVGLGDLRQLGWLGVRTLLYTLILSSSAVVIGLVTVNVMQPGKSLAPEKREALQAQYGGSAAAAGAGASKAKPLRDTLVDIIPENPLQEMVGAVDGSSKGNGMLAVMFFALACGAALISIGEKAAPVIAVLEGVFAGCMVITGFAMRLAPLAVACLMFSIASRLGLGIIATLGWFVLTALCGFALHLFVVYPLFIRFVAGRPPLQFFRDVQEAMITAFGTSSSNATLPTALKVAQENLKLSPFVSRFVLTVGATGNQNGTALYEGVVVLFLAQVFGVELTLPQQVTVVLMSVLAGVGTAGVPGGSIPLIVIVLRSVGVPGESIAIILGIDRLLDMCRTVLNVTGDLALATGVDRAAQSAAFKHPQSN
jgi:DAACS family dicarboxylate/amino acid:cation (Na+ or H+) symporter